MKTSDFDYELPEELIAQTPVEPRDHSRLLIYRRKTGAIEHKHFYDIIDELLLTAAIRAISKNMVPRASSKPRRFPAIENDWHGKPPQIRSISGKSSGMIFLASS